MKLELRLLGFGMASALGLALVPTVAFAQMGGQQCTDMQMLRHQCGQQHKSQQTKQKKPKSNYPNATRKEPKVKGLRAKQAKALNAGLAAANSHDKATALKKLQPIAEHGRNKYAKALALVGLAQVKYRAGDIKGAIAMEKQALALNSLPNNNYFPSLVSLAQMYIANKNYPDALAALDKWNQGSGAQSPTVYALQGESYYRLKKYPEAVAAIKKARSLSKTPQPSWAGIEMASYQAMGKSDEAIQLGQQILSANPNKSSTYTNLAKMYDSRAQNSSKPKPDAMKAASIIKQGMDKGVVQPGFATYKLLGNSYAIAGDYKDAVAAYGKAAPDAKNGTMDLRRGEMLVNLGRHKEAKAALEQALAKGGLQHVGNAYLALGGAELGMNHRAAAIKAYKKAAQHPEARKSAEKMLKQLGSK